MPDDPTPDATTYPASDPAADSTTGPATDPAADPSAAADPGSAAGAAGGGDPSAGAPATGGVQVTYPSGPTNSKQSGPLHVNNTNNDSGSVFLTNDLVTFEVENNRGDEVTCDFELQDDEQPGVVLAAGSLAWAAGEIGTKYIQFQGFPLRADQSTPTGSCNYTMTLTNHPDANEGTEVWENIY